LRRFLITWLAAISLVAMAASAQGISIQLESGVLKFIGWKPPSAPQNWSSIFTVYAGSGDVPALSGSYAVENGILVFHPRYPIEAGVQYRTIFQPAGGSKITKTFDGPPRDKTPAARVSQIYPSADVWPSNQLRLYVYFSAPMSRGEAAKHLHIVDENGKALEGAEAVLLRGEELWDTTFQRLTMTFDPGRIKRDLTSNRMIGPPIAEGKRYTLIVDREWPDARGVPMVEGFRKSYRGGPALRTPPDPKLWKITSPKAKAADPVIVDFPTSMNYPLLQRMIQVTGPRGNIAGSIDVQRQETQWRLTPQQPWSAGEYQLIVDTGIEDLAGNHIGQPFDFDSFDRVTEHITAKTVSLRFTIR
jgi:hypothetical protein